MKAIITKDGEERAVVKFNTESIELIEGQDWQKFIPVFQQNITTTTGDLIGNDYVTRIKELKPGMAGHPMAILLNVIQNQMDYHVEIIK